MEAGNRSVSDVLMHYGIKGMKWGVRRSQKELDRAAGRKPSKPGPSEDATRAASLKKKVRSGGTKALSNDEMKDLLGRMDLEQRYSRANPNLLKRGQSAVRDFISATGTANNLLTLANSPVATLVKTELDKK